MSSNTTMSLPQSNISSNANLAPNVMKCKKPRSTSFTKLNQAVMLGSSPLPLSVARRNERERNRVKMVNTGFAVLRQHVPNGAKNKKMSKVETLRSAVDYIRQLQKLLGNGDADSCFDTDDYQSMNLASDDENSYSGAMSEMCQSPMDSNGSLLDQQHILYTSSTPMGYQQQLYISSPEDSTRSGSVSGSYMLVTPNQSRTSPAPSIGSDMTTSSSSPYDPSQTMLNLVGQQQHPNQHQQLLHLQQSEHQQQQQQHNSRPTTAGNMLSAADDELFDFSNWF